MKIYILKDQDGEIIGAYKRISDIIKSPEFDGCPVKIKTARDVESAGFEIVPTKLH